jgi:hypothetical protein
MYDYDSGVTDDVSELAPDSVDARIQDLRRIVNEQKVPLEPSQLCVLLELQREKARFNGSQLELILATRDRADPAMYAIVFSEAAEQAGDVAAARSWAITAEFYTKSVESRGSNAR